MIHYAMEDLMAARLQRELGISVSIAFATPGSWYCPSIDLWKSDGIIRVGVVGARALDPLGAIRNLWDGVTTGVEDGFLLGTGSRVNARYFLPDFPKDSDPLQGYWIEIKDPEGYFAGRRVNAE